MNFNLEAKFKPRGDQPQAIEKLSSGLFSGVKNQVLLGVTGSGKTFTISNVIEKFRQPTLVISHNKTLAAQLYQELRDFFPNNTVSYFVSYYDFYQPEAYIPTTDTYIAKETQINEEIDKLRLAATTNILNRKDTIVVASVSAIYNLGSPNEYRNIVLYLENGKRIERKELFLKLLDLMYIRNDYAFKRGAFRVRGESIELYPAYEDTVIRITFSEDTISSLDVLDPLTGDFVRNLQNTAIYPAKHYITNRGSYDEVFKEIRHDLDLRIKELNNENKIVEAQRIRQRTQYDLKMIQELGYVNGIENYSRYFDGRAPGDAPYSLLEYFKESSDDFLLIIDESHMTIPQIRGMYNGDHARKKTLIDYGFRLPSAYDNRPLKFDEFQTKINKTIYMSATPDEWEVKLSGASNIAEQLIRPTGVVDPEIEVRPTQGQIDDLKSEIGKTVLKKERVLVNTLTKRMAEELTWFLEESAIKVQYLHSDVDTLKRQDILDDLREGTYDVLVGINLLREGLDLPEVSLVAILDADKEGFLRSRTSLIQIMGRAARRINSRVILYADNVTGSMAQAIEEVERRRKKQITYNKSHNINPISVEKEIKAKLVTKKDVLEDIKPLLEKDVLLPDEKEKIIKRLKKEMVDAAKMLDFETAALLRDKIRYLRQN